MNPSAFNRTLLKISEYKTKDTGAVLRELTAQWEAGELTALAFACKIGDRHHGIGITDDYRRDPLSALGVSVRIQHVINQLIDGRNSGKKETWPTN